MTSCNRLHQNHSAIILCLSLILLLWVVASSVEAAGMKYEITGEMKKWHVIAIDFKGPDADEMATDPNPFLDYRLQVVFTSPGVKISSVPGFFAGDGKGGGSGNIWRVLFSPDKAGKWSFRASFRRGYDVAVSLDPSAGEPVAFDGCAGAFEVGPREENARHGLLAIETHGDLAPVKQAAFIIPPLP